MNYRKVTYFVEVVREQSFSRAAQKLYVTQPMLSKVIHEIEEEFGATLIIRSSKTFQITEEGKIVYQQCLKIMNDFDELEHLLKEPDNLFRGSVSISIPAEVVSLYFIPLFIELQNKYPDIHFDLYEEGSNTVYDLVCKDEVDIGVVMLPVPTNSVEIFQIVGEQCVLAVNKKHPLAGEKSVHFSQLKDEHFILFNRHFTLYDLVRQACFLENFSPNIRFQSSRISIIWGLVEQNHGISILPEPALPNDSEKACKIPIIPEIPWNLAVIINKNKYQPPAVQQIVREIQEYFREYTPRDFRADMI